MKLQTLKDVERSIGGRPKLESTKVRLTFYLSKKEACQLKLIANREGISVSRIMRDLALAYIAPDKDTTIDSDTPLSTIM